MCYVHLPIIFLHGKDKRFKFLVQNLQNFWFWKIFKMFEGLDNLLIFNWNQFLHGVEVHDWVSSIGQNVSQVPKRCHVLCLLIFYLYTFWHGVVHDLRLWSLGNFVTYLRWLFFVLEVYNKWMGFFIRSECVLGSQRIPCVMFICHPFLPSIIRIIGAPLLAC